MATLNRSQALSYQYHSGQFAGLLCVINVSSAFLTDSFLRCPEDSFINLRQPGNWIKAPKPLVKVIMKDIKWSLFLYQTLQMQTSTLVFFLEQFEAKLFLFDLLLCEEQPKIFSNGLSYSPLLRPRELSLSNAFSSWQEFKDQFLGLANRFSDRQGTGLQFSQKVHFLSGTFWTNHPTRNAIKA